MSGARFVIPKVRLAELMRSPGGLAVTEAIARAEQNLEAIKPACRADMLGLLELCDAALREMGETYDEAATMGLYAIAVRGIGAGSVCGAPAVDIALTSLCDLLTHLQGRQALDRKAIEVHLQAWRLLMTQDLPQAACDTVIEGLRRVSAHHAAGPATPPATS